MTPEERETWNKAIGAAITAIHGAPVFPRHRDASPAADAERLAVLTAAARAVEQLKLP